MKVLQEQNIGTGFANSDQAASTLERTVLNPFLIKETGRRAGDYEKPVIRHLQKTKE